MDSTLSNAGGDAGAFLDRTTIINWLTESGAAIRSQRDYLIQLDAAIGDGDHGTNMNRGFEAVARAINADDGTPPGQLLVQAGRTMVSSVGGASGPLWGSALRQAGKKLGNAPTFDPAALLAALEAGLAAVVDLGAAQVGDKTMVDALQPAIAALRARLAAGQPLTEALRAAGEAAEAGMRATVPLQARRGRASYLGERSIGHQDPGATSSALIVRALERAVSGSSGSWPPESSRTG